ncbi:MAG TPA: hypothetical protein VFM58_12700 [Solirubrobacteraceae bacterium]|nr:hypothetical protein [Solirubrobacteraceae bacterium]
MTTLRRIALLLVLAVLVPAEVAHAGGWATVELGQAPSGLAAGKPWRVELIVKQHGITPMEGVTPSITIASGAGAERTFAARPTARVGHYVATVVFPTAGTWSAQISDGFTDAVPHRISTLHVGAAAPSRGAPLAAAAPPAPAPVVAAPAAAFPWPQAVMIAIVALLFAAGWIMAGGTVPSRERGAARGRRRATPRPVA